MYTDQDKPTMGVKVEGLLAGTVLVRSVTDNVTDCAVMLAWHQCVQRHSEWCFVLTWVLSCTDHDVSLHAPKQLIHRSNITGAAHTFWGMELQSKCGSMYTFKSKYFLSWKHTTEAAMPVVTRSLRSSRICGYPEMSTANRPCFTNVHEQPKLVQRSS